MKIVIKDWFENKLDLGYGKRLANKVADVVKETEKAYLINVDWESLDGEFDGVQNVWIPKSATMTLEEADAEEKAQEARFKEGCDRYNKMIQFAKANGIKGIRVGLRKETILAKIEKAGLVFEA